VLPYSDVPSVTLCCRRNFGSQEYSPAPLPDFIVCTHLGNMTFSKRVKSKGGDAAVSKADEAARPAKKKKTILIDCESALRIFRPDEK
jgi:hypothetical protein